MDILGLIGRSKALFNEDIANNSETLKKIVSKSSFLVIGGAGSIGQAVTKEIFKRNPISRICNHKCSKHGIHYLKYHVLTKKII